MYFQRDSKAMAIRILPKEIPIIDNLFAFLPEKIKELKEVSSLPHGIVLITGSTGSGKSTTLAAVIDYINKSFRKHVIMLEDPIEYLHVPLSAIITQRELGSDVRSFSEGLCAALREDPDIILVGEMRDKETIQTALEAARTGHLVFSTLHTNRALDTIMRIINVFPEEKQNEIRLDLSETLRYVMTQRLMRKKGGGRTVAVETLRVNDKISYLIKDKKYNKILDEPEYEPLEKSMAKLVEANIVEPEETQKHVTDQNMLNSFLKGGGKF
jgi:twitching motility protein PilT